MIASVLQQPACLPPAPGSSKGSRDPHLRLRPLQAAQSEPGCVRGWRREQQGTRRGIRAKKTFLKPCLQQQFPRLPSPCGRPEAPSSPEHQGQAPGCTSHLQPLLWATHLGLAPGSGHLPLAPGRDQVGSCDRGCEGCWGWGWATETLRRHWRRGQGLGFLLGSLDGSGLGSVGGGSWTPALPGLLSCSWAVEGQLLPVVFTLEDGANHWPGS